jgi:PmbA protein
MVKSGEEREAKAGRKYHSCVMKKPTRSATASARRATSVAPTDSPDTGFSYSRAFFEGLVDSALAHAKKLGATDAGAEASEGCGLSVNVRKGELETVERNRDKSLGITVYVGHRRGNASTSDFSPAAIERTVQAAYDIARFTAEDPVAGLPDEADIAPPASHRDLDLFHPWVLSSEEAARIAMECEAAAFATHKRITNSEGAGVSAQQSHFFSAHTHGFRGGYATSRHSISVAPIAALPGRNAEMQRDAWYSSMRDAADLASPAAVGRYAAERALSRLGSRKIATTECPVLFESTLAAGLLGGFVQAISGGALYRKSTFLLDSLGKKVFPKHIDILEDPFILRGKGSSPFDEEGVRVAPRKVVDAGRVEGYFLSSYSARKLGMKTTGNAGGSHNLVLSSRHTKAGDNLSAMLQKLGTGLFVIELMGQGVNYVTGDYSRGASGFWVENGKIAFPVHEITIAGNLKDMFKGIEAIGADAYNHGAKTVGSLLINQMKIAGS